MAVACRYNGATRPTHIFWSAPSGPTTFEPLFVIKAYWILLKVIGQQAIRLNILLSRILSQFCDIYGADLISGKTTRLCRKSAMV